MVRYEQYGPVHALRHGRPFLGVLPPLMDVRCYAVDGMLIDTGLAPLARQVLRFARARRITRAVITHHHEDHSGNGLVLAQDGIDVRASAATAEAMAQGFVIYPYQHLAWGRPPRSRPGILADVVETERYRFEVHPAPGHAHDQVVLHEPAEGWLFAGDVFLSDRIKLFRRDEDFHQSIATLKRLCALDFDTLFCAHRPVLTGGRRALERKLEYLLDVEEQVRAGAARGLARWRIARQVLGPEDPWMFALTAGDATRLNLVHAILDGPRPRPQHRP